eukprot:TRINITY_DN698_c0_g1_i1.p1 TRINITY_DN698_c0_g1~~TRINITY_DN698_c0_g1_i1.p1  ORF type:complete len:653 (+),score=127.68 TRINITY_DN698_c0_g1_i1:186-2144(+)
MCIRDRVSTQSTGSQKWGMQGRAATLLIALHALLAPLGGLGMALSPIPDCAAVRRALEVQADSGYHEDGPTSGILLDDNGETFWNAETPALTCSGSPDAALSGTNPAYVVFDTEDGKHRLANAFSLRPRVSASAPTEFELLADTSMTGSFTSLKNMSVGPAEWGVCSRDSAEGEKCSTLRFEFPETNASRWKLQIRDTADKCAPEIEWFELTACECTRSLVVLDRSDDSWFDVKASPIPDPAAVAPGCPSAANPAYVVLQTPDGAARAASWFRMRPMESDSAPTEFEILAEIGGKLTSLKRYRTDLAEWGSCARGGEAGEECNTVAFRFPRTAASRWQLRISAAGGCDPVVNLFELMGCDCSPVPRLLSLHTDSGYHSDGPATGILRDDDGATFWNSNVLGTTACPKPEDQISRGNPVYIIFDTVGNKPVSADLFILRPYASLDAPKKLALSALVGGVYTLVKSWGFTSNAQWGSCNATVPCSSLRFEFPPTTSNRWKLEISETENSCGPRLDFFELFGCEDDDGDGVRNTDDHCLDTALPVGPHWNARTGCVDDDGDGVLNNDDPCNDTSNPPGLHWNPDTGCDDDDGDGVLNNDDGCDDTATPPGPHWNPETGCDDDDGDGILNDNDPHPAHADKPTQVVQMLGDASTNE